MTFTPRTWVVGEVVSAALLNQEIRDQFGEAFAAWTTYTPTWTAATTNPAIGNAVLTGRYIKVGRTCTVVIRHQHGSTTTYGSGGYSWTLPFTVAAGVDYTGSARLVGSAAWLGQTISSGGSNALNAAFSASATDSRSATMSGSVPEVGVASAVVRMSLTYQTAT